MKLRNIVFSTIGYLEKTILGLILDLGYMYKLWSLMHPFVHEVTPLPIRELGGFSCHLSHQDIISIVLGKNYLGSPR